MRLPALFLLLAAAPALAQQRPAAGAARPDSLRPEATEVWTPVPPVVTPGAGDGAPPSDAVVLFDGTNLDAWVATNGGGPAAWTVADGVMTVDKAAGNIQTARSFGSYQLHLEWRIPANVTGTGQGRGNSGLFLASTGRGDGGYELQILDSYRNETYVNGQAGAVYKQFAPLANAMRPPGEWQTFDVVWTAPHFDSAGAVTRPATLTAFHNGVLIQHHVTLEGPTRYIGRARYGPAHGPTPIKLQSHGDPSEPISFRNIWVRELP